ncbi:MAG: 4Fe-4S ferredoxin [Acidimicrobiia bacterium]|nr:MAG: 4Fe-4S ferredoxin [Acidimicrobiia bacterium]
MDETGLARLVRQVGVEAGLRVGICDAEPFRETRSVIEERKALGLSAGLTFTYRRPGRSTDVRVHFPWARRIVVGAYPYLPEAGRPPDRRPGQGRVARFATDDHYRPLRRGLTEIAEVLRRHGRRAVVLCDDNRLVDRAAAVRAGVGWWGKNTMVLVPGFGPWTLLGSVVTDAELPVSGATARSCGRCSACLPACPTGALIAPGVMDARRCLAAILQLPGPIPRELREAVGDRVYGCDDCLEACPPGKRIESTARTERGGVDLVELLTSTDEELLARFGRFYLPGRRPAYLRRNALVALGNVGHAGHLPLVVAYTRHPDPLLRGHAAWAMAKLGGARARSRLSELASDDPSAEVRDEASAALAQLSNRPVPSGR